MLEMPESDEKQSLVTKTDVLHFVSPGDSESETREKLRSRRGWILVPTLSSKSLESGSILPAGDLLEQHQEDRLSLLASCRDCHPHHYDGFFQTAHARTSARP